MVELTDGEIDGVMAVCRDKASINTDGSQRRETQIETCGHFRNETLCIPLPAEPCPVLESVTDGSTQTD